MIEIIIAAVIGLGIGIGGTLFAKRDKKEEPVIVAVGGDEVARGQVDVQKLSRIHI